MKLTWCDNTLQADLHCLNLLNLSWPSDCLVVSLISGKEYFKFLYGHTKHNIHNREGGRKENKQTRTWVSSKRKKGEDCDTFLAFFELSRVCIRAKFPRMLTHPLTLANPALTPQVLTLAVACSLLPTALFCPLLCSASFSWLSASPDFCRLPCSLPWSLLSTSVDSRTFLSSSSSGLVGNLTPKQKNLLTDTYPHNEYPTSCHTGLTVLSLPLFVFSHFSLSKGYIFLCLIPFLYLSCKFLLFVSGFSVLFHFWQISTRYISWFSFSCDFVNL